MSTRSLILHPHEVRAALDGRLGLVVRPVMPQPPANAAIVEYNPADYSIEELRGKLSWFDPFADDLWPCDRKDAIPCPLGVPGDRLRCRETWDFIPWTFESIMILYGVDAISRELPSPKGWHPTLYGYQRWRSPATMPAWASRITLEVVGVRCVRVQEITEGDIYNIGAEWDVKHAHTDGIDVLGGFIRWWNQYYVKRGLSWGSNPFVWAVEVRRVEG